MAVPQDPAAAGRGRLRVGHADREQVIDTLKGAFTQGRLTGDELDARTGQALAARTYAELDAVIADIPGAPRLDGPPASPVPAGAGVADPPALARRWPLATAAVKAGGFVAVATAIAYSGNMIDNADPNGPGPGPHHGWTRLLLLLALTLMVTAFIILGRGVAASVEQRRSRRQLPPRPGQGGQPPEVQRPGQAGHDPALPRDRPDQARADLRPDSSQPGRPHPSGRGGRAPRGIRPAQDAG
jgi:Domain of unknown function (DUF1707)